MEGSRVTTHSGGREMIEQALYSLDAMADDADEDGNADRARLLRTCEKMMRSELDRLVARVELLRTLAQASLDARDKEAKAALSLENAQTNFHRFDAEERAHEQAMIEASEADRALREALTTPNA